MVGWQRGSLTSTMYGIDITAKIFDSGTSQPNYSSNEKLSVNVECHFMIYTMKLEKYNILTM